MRTYHPRPYESSLDRAAGFELDWKRVPPVFEATRSLESPCFVYFIGEEDDGAMKIGTAKDPICRLRELQTGNPRSLSIEHVLVGDVKLERQLHARWWSFAMTSMRNRRTEWFEAAIRDTLEPVVILAAQEQIKGLERDASAEELERIVSLAHIACGIDI
jgi:hypothetical protein